MNPSGHREMVHYQLIADAAAVSRVRRLIAVVLTGWMLTDLADDVSLCVSELFGNIVQHAVPPCLYPAPRDARRVAPQADILLSPRARLVPHA
jgi:hypothetical protein